MAWMARRAFVAASGGLLASPALAQGLSSSWPSRPIRLLVGFAPGGTTDIMARLAAEKLGPMLGQPVVVENLPGATGNIAAAAAARAEPDGHTLLLGSPGPLALNRWLFKTMPFDSRTAFAPIGLIAVVPNVVMVRPDLPARTLGELEALLKGGQLRTGSPGVGTTGHLTNALFQAAVGAQAVHAGYRGSVPMLTDLMAGHIDYAVDQLSPPLPLLRDGKLRAVAVSSAQRSALLPNVPTMDEQGRPGLSVTAWFSLVAPTGTPAAAISRINTALNAALLRPETREQLALQAASPGGGTPESLAALIRTEEAAAQRAVALAGIQPE